ncbi:MAG: carbohydrate binding domain-containing protein [Gammaproteobacteria bacterium]|nr:carbohydrate binding domain-containing protein [Gammaproteobacteria bacterium]
MFFNKLTAPACVKNLPAKILGLSLLALPHYAMAGIFMSTLNNFSYEATGPMGLGRAAVADDVNKGYQMVDSKVSIVASPELISNVVINYAANFTLVDGVLTNTIDADGYVFLYFDIVVTDVDPVYDFYGKEDGGSHSFAGIAVEAKLSYVSSVSGVAQFTLDVTGTDVTKDLNGVSLALNTDVNGVDENLVPITDITIPGYEGYLDVIKFKGNEFLTALTNMNLTLSDGVITYNPTPALLSGGIQDEYLDPEFSFLMEPQGTTTSSGNGSILDGTSSDLLGGWSSIYGGTASEDTFSLSGKSIYVSNRTSSNSGLVYDGKDLLLSNEVYTLEADIFVTGSNNATFYPKVKSRTGAKNTYTTIGKEILTPNEWHHVVMEFNTPDISQASSVEILLNGFITSADFYIDNISIVGQAAATTTTEPEPIDPNGYLLNDDFETGDKQSWNSSGGVNTVETFGSQSSYSIRNSARGSSMHGLYKSILNKVNSNTTYILDVDVYKHGGTSSALIAEVKSRVGAKNTFTRVGKQTIQPDAWNHVTMEVTLPDIDNASLVDLKFYGIVSASDFSIDNVQLRAK